MNRQRTNFGVGGWEIAPVGVVAGLLTGLLTGLACGQQYTVTDLGTLGGPSLTGYPGSQAYGLNDAGEVCGMSVLANDVGDLHAFRWDGAMTELLPTGGDPLSTAFAINSSGQVVGISHTLGAIETTAVRWDGASPFVLGNFAPHDISDLGVVVGEMPADPTGVFAHAVRWENGTLTDLNTLGGSHSSAYAVNEEGWIVGRSFLAGNLSAHAFLWRNGTMTDLGTLGGSNSAAHAVNGAGQIVGVAQTAAGALHAVLYETDAAGTVTGTIDLGVLGLDYSTALAINEVGAVVGTSDSRAFRWSGGTMEDLNDLIAADSGWRLSQATAINNVGQIAGSGLHNGRFRAFLLTPLQTENPDINGDGVVDVADLIELIVNWGPCPPGPCAADINGDGTVDVSDLVTLIVGWSS